MDMRGRFRALVVSVICAMALMSCLTHYSIYSRFWSFEHMLRNNMDMNVIASLDRAVFNGLNPMLAQSERRTTRIKDSNSKSNRCNSSTPTHRDEMLSVDNENHTYVFSAYMDIDKGRTIVRVIGITIANDTDRPPMWCILWRNCSSEKTSATVRTIPEGHRHRFTATYIICHWNEAFGEPSQVAVVSNSSHILNWVRVEPASDRDQYNFTVCVAPFKFAYDNMHQLLEYIVVNRLFGADFFVFYNNSMSARVSRALEMFVSQGLAEVVPWQIPGHVLQDLNCIGQLVATNDCSFRFRHKTLYIVQTDLDEFIVPRQSTSWLSMIQPALNSSPFAAAFYVRSYLFITEWESRRNNFSQRPAATKYKSMTLLKTNRSKLELRKNERQKYIWNPKRVETAGVHFIWTPLSGFKGVFVDILEGALHHYRKIYPFAEARYTKQGTTTDTYMHAFQDRIVAGLVKQWTNFESYIQGHPALWPKILNDSKRYLLACIE